MNNPTNRPFVLVSETLWSYYHQRRREIDAEWQSQDAWSDAGVLTAAFTAIRAMRAELGADVRRLSEQMPGNYIVPV